MQWVCSLHYYNYCITIEGILLGPGTINDWKDVILTWDKRQWLEPDTVCDAGVVSLCLFTIPQKK